MSGAQSFRSPRRRPRQDSVRVSPFFQAVARAAVVELLAEGAGDLAAWSALRRGAGTLTSAEVRRIRERCEALGRAQRRGRQLAVVGARPQLLAQQRQLAELERGRLARWARRLRERAYAGDQAELFA